MLFWTMYLTMANDGTKNRRQILVTMFFYCETFAQAYTVNKPPVSVLCYKII